MNNGTIKMETVIFCFVLVSNLLYADQENTTMTGGVRGQVMVHRGEVFVKGSQLWVQAIDEKGDTIGRSFTDDDGYYELWLPPGIYKITVADVDTVEHQMVVIESDKQIDGVDIALDLYKLSRESIIKKSWILNLFLLNLLPLFIGIIVGILIAFSFLHFFIYFFELHDIKHPIYSFLLYVYSHIIFACYNGSLLFGFYDYLNLCMFIISLSLLLYLRIFLRPDTYFQKEIKKRAYYDTKIFDKQYKWIIIIIVIGYGIFIFLNHFFISLGISYIGFFIIFLTWVSISYYLLSIYANKKGLGWLAKERLDIKYKTHQFILSLFLPFAYFYLYPKGYLNWFTLLVICLLLGTILKVIFIQKREGTKIIGLGTVLFFLGSLYKILSMEGIESPIKLLPWFGSADQWFDLADQWFLMGLMSFVFSMSVYLARNYVNTSKSNYKITQELEQARQLQLSMLPKTKPSTPHLDISWYMETATEVGGDYYDYSLSVDGTLTITLGDATGHGMQAGTVVTATKSLFQNLANQPIITETFTAMSRSLKGMNFPRLGMAMTMLKITDHKLLISSAGIPPALLYRANTQEIEEIEIGGMPLGYSTNFPYEQREYDLHPGDTIVLMSDGLPERFNPDDEELGFPRTQELFRECAEKSPEEICQLLAQGGDEWARGRPQDDDITFVVIKVK